jgi:hypothetical protein
MKKIILVGLTLIMVTALGGITPARANNNFWPGVAVGVGSAIILSQIAHAAAGPYYGPAPVRVYGPPPPVYRERVVVREYPGYYRPHTHWRHHHGY